MTDKKEMLLVVSKARKLVKQTHGASLGMDACEALTDKIITILKEAAEKAKADHRKVIKSRDI